MRVFNLHQSTGIENFNRTWKKATRTLLVGMALIVSFGLSANRASAQASDVYITQDGGGSGICTSGVHPASWFNNSGNWGSGSAQIGPDTIVHLCGTITSTLAAQGNGTSGHPWTLLFEPGARISHPFCGDNGQSCLNLSGHSFFVIDGGTPCGWISNVSVACNGKIEATANGSTLANKSSIVGGTGAAIFAGVTHDWELKNIEFSNIYVRVLNSGDRNGGNSEGIYLYSGPINNVHIHNVIAHDLHWFITADADPDPINNVEMDHFYTYNVDHTTGIGMGNGVSSGFLIHDFHIGTTRVWDTATNDNHHDGIHFYDGSSGRTGGAFLGVQIWNGLFDGDWGTNNTAHIFFEGNINATIFNNVSISPAGTHVLNNGFFNNCNSVQSHTVKMYNNTIIFLNGGPYFARVCGTTDIRNNAFLTNDTSGGNNVANGPGSGTWNYNVYAAPNPGSSIFSNTGSCCTLNYPQWKSNLGFDLNSIAIQSPPMGLSTSTGAPSAGSPVINAGTNLTSLGIAALQVDRTGAARPSTGSWDAGAFKFGSSTVDNTPPLPPTGLNVVVQ